MPDYVFIADLPDPADPQGRSYREVNAERQHLFEIGSLVALETGDRYHVKALTRDCDQTPLYVIGAPDSPESQWLRGVAEEYLTAIEATQKNP